MKFINQVITQDWSPSLRAEHEMNKVAGVGMAHVLSVPSASALG
jgi:hypothetical protein